MCAGCHSVSDPKLKKKLSHECQYLPSVPYKLYSLQVTHASLSEKTQDIVIDIQCWATVCNAGQISNITRMD